MPIYMAASPDIQTFTGAAADAEIMSGADGTNPAQPEYALGDGTANFIDANRVWTADLSNGLDSGYVPVSFHLKFAASGGSDTWVVGGGQPLTQNLGSGNIGSVVINVGVRTAGVAIQFQDLVANFSHAGSQNEADAIPSALSANTTDLTAFSSENTCTIVPAQANDDEVLITGKIRLMGLQPDCMPAPTDLFAQVLTYKWQPPTIARLSASASAISPKKLIFSVQGVGESNSDGTINQVAVYRESNGITGLQVGPGGDSLLGNASEVTSDTWNLEADSSSFSPGNTTLYARATDSIGQSSVDSAASTLNAYIAPPNVTAMYLEPVAGAAGLVQVHLGSPATSSAVTLNSTSDLIYCDTAGIQFVDQIPAAMKPAGGIIFDAGGAAGATVEIDTGANDSAIDVNSTAVAVTDSTGGTPSVGQDILDLSMALKLKLRDTGGVTTSVQHFSPAISIQAGLGDNDSITLNAGVANATVDASRCTNTDVTLQSATDPTTGVVDFGNRPGVGNSLEVRSAQAIAVLKVAQTIDSVQIQDGGKVILSQTGAHQLDTFTSLRIYGGLLDVGEQNILTNTDPAVIQGYLTDGFDGGAWDGSFGIASSFVSRYVDPELGLSKYALGFAFGGDASVVDQQGGDNANLEGLGSHQTLIRPVLLGDVDISGTVDFGDIASILGYHYNDNLPAHYTDGDITFDRLVDIDDLCTVLASNYASGEIFLRHPKNFRRKANYLSKARMIFNALFLMTLSGEYRMQNSVASADVPFRDSSVSSDRRIPSAPTVIDLTVRESGVLGYLKRGFSEKEIAKTLDLSVHTIHFHVKAIYKKFGVGSRGELLSIWIRANT